MRKSLDEIKETLKKHEKELKEKYGVKEIGIFGSYLRGEAKEGSDLDILVEFEKSIGFFKFLELEEYLADLIGGELPPAFAGGFLLRRKDLPCDNLHCGDCTE